MQVLKQLLGRAQTGNRSRTLPHASRAMKSDRLSVLASSISNVFDETEAAKNYQLHSWAEH